MLRPHWNFFFSSWPRWSVGERGSCFLLAWSFMRHPYPLADSSVNLPSRVRVLEVLFPWYGMDFTFSLYLVKFHSSFSSPLNSSRSFSWPDPSTQRIPPRPGQIFFSLFHPWSFFFFFFFLLFLQCPFISFLWCLSYWCFFFKLMLISFLSFLPNSAPERGNCPVCHQASTVDKLFMNVVGLQNEWMQGDSSAMLYASNFPQQFVAKHMTLFCMKDESQIRAVGGKKWQIMKAKGFWITSAAVPTKLLSRAKTMSLIFCNFLYLLSSRSHKAILITSRFAEELFASLY